VPPRPLPAAVSDAVGQPVGVGERYRITAPPHAVAVDGAEPARVTAWAGPWPLEQRWWEPGADSCSRLQVITDDGAALLLSCRNTRWTVVGVYD
jgi:protein ImuB